MKVKVSFANKPKITCWWLCEIEVTNASPNEIELLKHSSRQNSVATSSMLLDHLHANISFANSHTTVTAVLHFHTALSCKPLPCQNLGKTFFCVHVVTGVNNISHFCAVYTPHIQRAEVFSVTFCATGPLSNKRSNRENKTNLTWRFLRGLCFFPSSLTGIASETS